MISNVSNVLHLILVNLHSQHFIKWQMSNRIAYILFIKNYILMDWQTFIKIWTLAGRTHTKVKGEEGLCSIKHSSAAGIMCSYSDLTACQTFVKIMYFCVLISNNLLFDLDQHSHSPFFKMVAIKINITLSFELYHLQVIYLYQDKYLERVFNLMKYFAFDVN